MIRSYDLTLAAWKSPESKLERVPSSCGKQVRLRVDRTEKDVN